MPLDAWLKSVQRSVHIYQYNVIDVCYFLIIISFLGQGKTIRLSTLTPSFTFKFLFETRQRDDLYNKVKYIMRSYDRLGGVQVQALFNGWSSIFCRSIISTYQTIV